MSSSPMECHSSVEDVQSYFGHPRMIPGDTQARCMSGYALV